MGDFIEDYISYNVDTEANYICHRWTAIALLGAVLGRNAYLQHGGNRIFPNVYVMLIGEPAARKSTAIKAGKKLLGASGYDSFSADYTTKEKLLLDMEGLDDEGILLDKSTGKVKYDDVMAKNLWGEDEISSPKEMFIVADEWNDFAGQNNINLYTTLGTFWDWDDPVRPYTHRLKNSKSVSIFQPTVSIIGGNTHENFAKAFPPETLGIGFLSRMLLVYCEHSGRQITFPFPPKQEDTDALTDRIRQYRTYNYGALRISQEALTMLDKIYKGWLGVNDVRFRHFNSRRFTHLLKLSIIHLISACGDELTTAHIIQANTVLACAEQLMPRALGEFGKSKNSDVTTKIITLLEAAHKPLTVKDLFRYVHQDLEKPQQLIEMLQSLQTADKAMWVKSPMGGGGWLAKKEAHKPLDYVDFSLLTEDERKLL